MHFIQQFLKPHLLDVKGKHLQAKAEKQLHIQTGKIATAKVFSLDTYFAQAIDNDIVKLQNFGKDCIQDIVTDDILVNELAQLGDFKTIITVAKLAGVTDDEGISTQEAFADYFGLDIDTHTQHIFSQELFYIQNELDKETLKTLSKRLLGNPLINHFSYFTKNEQGQFVANLFVPEVHLSVDTSVKLYDLDISDAELLQLSKTNIWSLNLEEMKAIQAHFQDPKTIAQRVENNLPAQPTDCEVEILAQTWSEHCKHKEFNAVIEFENKATGERKTIKSLFKTYIRAATEKVKEKLEGNGNDWLVKIFTDNAGVVKINSEKLFVWKVETHNSPSALDPYGGAITGILGNNRDPLGTGIGGAKLLFNTNVLCFGFPDYDKPLLSGQLHPRQIMEGVVSGIKDGGNKSGVPTINGAVVFDERFSGKPLVYCGTGGVMPHHYKGKNSWEKPIDAGDRIVVIGGRVGADGIHGATFSSLEIDEHAPATAVQIGSPITQKKVGDFLIKAAVLGLIKCSTDNGAGGLSSSIGELATISGGAVVYLDKVPLKYAGLKPWEIFVSESQERMTLVVEPANIGELEKLANLMAVELTDIGIFTNSGVLDVRFGDKNVAFLSMEFLHDGVPQKYLKATLEIPKNSEPILNSNLDYNDIIENLLASWNICSRESIIRQYDHEVKGKSIIKPLMGKGGTAPQDAAVVRVGFDSTEGIAISNGIAPQYGDLDAYEMSCGAFDEALRQIISVGGRLPNTSYADNVFWSVNDNFCVPDSVFDAQNNPDGQQKLAKLVQICEGLYDMATFFDVPLTSGKDSMKNDFKSDGVKISVPPTILYSMAAKVEDFRKVVTSEFKQQGDLVYQLGETYNELGASKFYDLHRELGANVPKVRKQAAKELYLKVMQANELGLIQSSHDLSDGGLAIAIAESCFGGNLGANITLDNFSDLDVNSMLFSESHSRFVVSIAPENKAKFAQILGNRATFLGTVEGEHLTVQFQEKTIINLSVQALENAWRSKQLV